MIGIAVIGVGHWGPNLVRNFQEDSRTSVRWVIDHDPARLNEVGTRYPDVHLGKDPSDALRDPTVDAVVIATPTSTHHDLAIMALEAGRHVLIEKPLAASLAQARHLQEIAHATDVVVMVGHVFLFNAAIERAKTLIDESIGRLYYATMQRTNLGPIRTDVNAAWDLAAHDISIAQHWLGVAPEAVSAVGQSWINPDVEDAVFATMRYPGDVLVASSVSWLNPQKVRSIAVVGERQMLTIDDMDLTHPLRVYNSRVDGPAEQAGFVNTMIDFRKSIRQGDVTIPRIAHSEPLRSECEHFVDCIEHSRPPRCGVDLGFEVVRVLDAIERSLRSDGREVIL
ncbi:MAG: Gfo/Idh/MocA family protein [Actinomycetota bacterium]